MSDLLVQQDLKRGDLSSELWREYDFQDRTYRILNPVEVRWRAGGTTHRVLDGNGTVHCLPAPGQLGCVLRWQNKPGVDPVQW